MALPAETPRAEHGALSLHPPTENPGVGRLSAPPRSTMRAALLLAFAALAVPADAQPWTVRLRGIGPVAFGATIDAASRAAVVSFDVIETRNDSDCGYVRPSVPYHGIFLMTDGDRIVRADMTVPYVRTRSGIGVGSSEAEVRAAYGDRITTEGHPYDDDSRYLIYTPRDAADAHYRVIFETAWGYVTRYRSGLLPAVHWIEGCS